MNCSEIREALLGGVLTPNAPMQEHLASCAQCRELFEHDAKLGRSLAEQATAGAPFPEHAFSEMEQRLAAETGLRAWLRSRPTRLRFQIIAASVLLMVIVGGVLRPRWDFDQYPLPRVIALLGGYFLLLLLATRRELGHVQRPGRLANRPALVLWILALPVLAAFAPATEACRHTGPEGALNCFVYGALLTLPTALLLWAFDRDEQPSLASVCLSAVTLGLSASLLLELHCPSGNLRHVLLGHASIGLVWLAAGLVARRSFSSAGRARK